jgi:hypothetical protein
MSEEAKTSMDFNWVKARSECSVKRAFETLFEVVETNVKTANELRLGPKFHATYQHKKIIVTREDNSDDLRNVVFELTSTAIIAREGQSKQLFSARPRLNETGECLLEVDGSLYKLWQISQKALEDLFFS